MVFRERHSDVPYGNIIKNLGLNGTAAIKGIGRTYNNGSMTSRSNGNSYSANRMPESGLIGHIEPWQRWNTY